LPDAAVTLTIDRPLVAGDAAVGPVRGHLIVEGWALAAGGIAAVTVAIDDGAPVAAHYGCRRRDLAARFPDDPDAGTAGFILIVPSGALAAGRHRVRVVAAGRDGAAAEAAFDVAVEAPAAEEGPGVLRRKVPLAEIRLGEDILAGLGWRPGFGLLLGIGESEAEVEEARATLASLRDQTYPRWHAAVVRRGRFAPEHLARRLLDGFDDVAGRIRFGLDAPPATPLAELVHPADLVGILLAGDRLGADALAEFAIASGLHPEAELLYSDERRISPASGRMEAFFKPQWSPELLAPTNYVGRFWCALPGIFNRARLDIGEWFQFGDYGLVLRCTEVAAGIRHIPRVLCQRGRAQLDHPDQERAALARALARRGEAGTVADGAVPGYYRIVRPAAGHGLVSIVIATCAARGLVKTCIESLRERTAYRDIEIVCIENIPARERRWKRWLAAHADRVVSADGPFNWAAYNNRAAREARGRFLVFLNDDTEIVAPDWLDALIAQAARPEIGAVGARLLYPDGRVQHAGIFWTPAGGRHAFRHAAADDPGYFALAQTERNVVAVTGACLAVRRDEFDAQGGFDESHAIVNNDVDFCLRVWERGKRVVYAPQATLVHREMASRHALGDDYDVARFARRWARLLTAGDPFFHPSLHPGRDDYAPHGEPLELVYSGRPLFDPADIRSILAVKLDHIGDFVTAIPALQRLRQDFPRARLSLLAPPASAAVARLVPGLGDVIEFEFFFARSGLGRKELTAEDYAELRRRLAPYRFDLAIDLRKLPETRPILQLTGARWLAGFDRDRQFPFLDIVMPWEGDPPATRKRNPVGDDLLRLAEAVAAAARPIGELLPRPPARRAGRRRVCIHPATGAPIRQWPAGHFAALIDLIAAAHDVEIVVIGGADEAELADRIVALCRRREAVTSLAGRVGLAELPELLAGCALFVGNNSGPKHIAAALGVPTVGIESGTVDPREWGPNGARAVALRRDMACSPCYLSDPADCWRGLACLEELRPAEVFALCNRLLAIDATR
jgi:ADP-heptose:LPS heptosyltransferase/GT2 family glycosyltransferase